MFYLLVFLDSHCSRHDLLFSDYDEAYRSFQAHDLFGEDPKLYCVHSHIDDSGMLVFDETDIVLVSYPDSCFGGND